MTVYSSEGNGKPAVKYPYFLTKIFLYVVLSFYLLYPGLHGYSNIQHEKAVSFFIIFGGYLGLMLLFTVEMALMGKLRLVSPRSLWKKADLTQKAVVIYCAVSILSASFSPHRAAAWLGMSRYEGACTILIYCGCFICVSAFAPDVAWMMRVFGASMVLYCVLCLLQMHGYDPLKQYPDGLSYFDANIEYPGIYLGTTGNADYVAALLCMATAVFFVLLLRRKDRMDLLYILPLTLCVIVLVKMNVQAGLVAILCGTLLILPAVLPLRTGVKLLLWMVFGVCTVVGIVVIYHVPVNGTLYELQQILHGNWNERFGSGRIYIWKQVLQRIPDHLVFGTGPDTMMAARILGDDFVLPDGYVLKTGIDAAHNEYLNILYHQGVIGLLSYLTIVLSLLVRWLRSDQGDRIAHAVGAAAVFYCIQAFFGIAVCLTSGVFWVLMGILENRVYKRGQEI